MHTSNGAHQVINLLLSVRYGHTASTSLGGQQGKGRIKECDFNQNEENTHVAMINPLL